MAYIFTFISELGHTHHSSCKSRLNIDAQSRDVPVNILMCHYLVQLPFIQGPFTCYTSEVSELFILLLIKDCEWM